MDGWLGFNGILSSRTTARSTGRQSYGFWHH